ncbi:hypothetical protein NMY22_g18992 [Coprinellus aureogranulatus]|nr:hypothetical protein NMY22_g18992 [Coprinellus aureogranulatus]
MSAIDLETPSNSASLTDVEPWRRSGHKFDDLSYQVRTQLRRQLAIPEGLDVAPASRLSVLDFAVSLLPSVSHADVFPTNFNFFSQNPPTALTSDMILSVDVPPKGVVAGLLAQALQQYLDGAESVVHPLSGFLFPIWVLTLWTNFHIEYAPGKQKWNDAISWLQRSELQPFMHVVKGVVRSLASLTWAGKLSYESPLGAVTFSKDLLTVFLSKTWLADEHIDLLICWLSEKVLESGSLTPTLLLNTCHIHLIQKAHQEGAVSNGTSSTVLDRLGRSLRWDSQVGGIFHVKGNHWVAIVVIPGEGRVLYGDPAGLVPEKEAVSAVIWFCQQYLPSTPSPDEFTYEILPSPTQNLSVDWWNCGIFSFNALEYHLLPEQSTLFQFTEKPGFGNAARIAVLDEIIKSRLEHVGLHELALSLRRKDLTELLSPSDSLAVPPPPPPKASWPIQWNKDATESTKSKKPKKSTTKKKAAVKSEEQADTEETRKAKLAPFLTPTFSIPTIPNPNELKRKANGETEVTSLPKKQYSAFTHLTTVEDDATDSDSDSPQNQQNLQMPLELILDIIEIAASSDPISTSRTDVQLLKTCTLVCKAWSLPVQKLLFQNVSLRSRGQYTSFVRAVSKSTTKGKVLAEAVRKLNITIDYAHPSPITQRAFARAVSACPRLQHLDVSLYGRDDRLGSGPGVQAVGEVEDGRLRRRAPPFSDETLEALRNGPQVTSLSLRNWTENQLVLFQLLDIYSSSVASLSLSGSAPSSPPSNAPWSGRLTSLHTNLQTSPSLDFMSWLLHTTSTGASLRNLTFEREPCPDLFEWVMEACGKDLRSLSLPSLPAPSHSASSSSSPSMDRRPPPLASPQAKTATAHASVPRTVKHLVVGLDKDTALQPVIDLVKTRHGLEAVSLRMWSGGEGHRLLPILKIACAVRGVDLVCV